MFVSPSPSPSPETETTITLIETLLPVESYQSFKDFYRTFQQSRENGLNLPPDITARTEFINHLLQIYEFDLMQNRDLEEGGVLPEDVAQIMESVQQIMPAPAPADKDFEDRFYYVINVMKFLLELSSYTPRDEQAIIQAAQEVAADVMDAEGDPQEIDSLPFDRFEAELRERIQILRSKIQTVLSSGYLITIFYS